MIKLVTDNNELNTIIRTLFKQNSRIKCAVAFWGTGAVDLFRNTQSRDIQIVCNLFSGATNPAVILDIRKLTKATNIRMDNNLHAKVYWTEKGVVIGSNNASSNGLALQGVEVTGWKEASLFTDEQSIIQNVAEWFDDIFYGSKSINNADIQFAQKLWEKRRVNRPYTKNNSQNESALLPETISDRNIYITIDTDFFGAAELKAGKKSARQLKINWPNINNEEVEYWLDFDDVPRNAVTYQFIAEKNRVIYKGIFRTLDRKYDTPYKNGRNFQYCLLQKRNEDNIPDLKVSQLKKLVQQYYNKNKTYIHGRQGCAVKIEEIYTMG